MVATGSLSVRYTMAPDYDADRRWWFVMLNCTDTRPNCLYFGFARKKDAVAAMKAIESLIDWSGPMSAIIERVRAYGDQRIQQAMLEAMAW